MIWIAVILSLFIGGLVGLISRSLVQGLKAGAIVLVLGVLISLLIVYSGVMGG